MGHYEVWLQVTEALFNSLLRKSFKNKTEEVFKMMQPIFAFYLLTYIRKQEF